MSWTTACAKSASGGSKDPTNWPNNSKLIIPNSCVHTITPRTSASGGTLAGAPPRATRGPVPPLTAERRGQRVRLLGERAGHGAASRGAASSPVDSASRMTAQNASGTRAAGPIVASGAR